MEHVTRTVYFSSLQSAMVRGGVHKWLEHTTLNEKFNVLPKDYPPHPNFPILSYIVIGRGALGMTAGADGKPDVVIGQHRNTDAALFDHMPFVLRTLDNDLPPERRNRYVLRELKEYFGVQYWAYWGRRVDFSLADTDLFVKTVLEDGSVRVEAFVPDESNLSPTPVDLSNTGTNLLAGVSTLASTVIPIPLDTFDINEIRNASTIMKRVTGKATISELALCTGSVKSIQAQGVNGTFTFNEAIGVQIAAHIQTLYPMDFINRNLTDELELGISEPMFRLEGVNA